MYVGLNKQIMDAAAQIGMNPVSKHQIQPKYMEQADAGYNTCVTMHACHDDNTYNKVERLANE